MNEAAYRRQTLRVGENGREMTVDRQPFAGIIVVHEENPRDTLTKSDVGRTPASQYV
jgi:hypothetical protein